MKKTITLLLIFAALTGRAQVSDAVTADTINLWITPNLAKLITATKLNNILLKLNTNKMHKDSLVLVSASGDTIFLTQGASLDTIIAGAKELEELSDVDLTTPDGFDLLRFDDESNLWKNVSYIALHDTTMKYLAATPTVYSTWVRDTTKAAMFQATLTDKVGIGTTTPDKNLDVNGAFIADTVFERLITEKRWLIFGDSFSSTLTPYWPSDAIKLLGVDSTTTEAVGGATIKSQLDTLTARLAADANYLSTYEIISLWIGINDYGPTDLGSITDTAGAATFAGSLKKFIKTVYINKPEAELYIMTPLPSFRMAYRGYTAKGYNIEDMAILMSQVCDSLNTPCVDMFHLAGVNKYTFTTLLGADSLHMSHAGRHIVSKIFVDAVKNRSGNKGQSFNYNYINATHSTGAADLNLKAYGTGKVKLHKPLNFATNTALMYAGGTSRIFYRDSLNNIGIGAGSLASVTTSFSNIAIGYNALNKIAASGGGAGATAVGYAALSNSTSSGVAFGNQAGFSQTNGVFNTYVGANSGYLNSTGSANTYIGHNSGMNRTGGYNTAVGYLALAGSAAASGQNNTAIGTETGKNNNSGGNNNFFGWRAGWHETGSYKSYWAADSTQWANGMSSISKLLMYSDMSNAAKSAHFMNIFAKVSIGAAKDPTVMLEVSGNAIVTGSFKSGTGTVADGDTTPDVSGYNTFIYAGSATASTTVTDLTNPVVGMYYTFFGNSDTYVLQFGGSNFKMTGSSPSLGLDDNITFYVKADNYYIEQFRANINP